MSPYVRLTRPFTLLMPALGMLTGGIIALGAGAQMPAGTSGIVPEVGLRMAIGTVMAAVLNAASNVLNQVCDLEIDRINKPERVLPAGDLTVRQALRFSVALYVVAVALSVLVGRVCAAIVLVTALATWAYSAPPFRLKRFLFVANFTVAVPRGMLLKVAGWSAVGSILSKELWFIATIFGVFVFGAVSTKDFSDVEGDRLHGCLTLPIRYGNRTAALLIAPFFFAPSLLIGAGLALHCLGGSPRVLAGLAALLAVWGAYVVRLMLAQQEARLAESNQASWTHMYLMSFALQIGFAAAYLGGYERGGPSTVAESKALVEQAVAAHGGLQNIAHLENMKVISRGRFKEHTEFRRTLQFRAPGTWSMRIEALGGVAMAFGVDSDRCWRKARQMVWACSEADRREYGRMTDVLNARLLMLRGHDVRPAGAVDVRGEWAPAVTFGDLLLAFDPTTHLLLQVRYDQGWVESFADYQRVAGVLVATRRTLTIDDQPDVEETWETIVPDGAEPEELRAPALSEAGVTVDEVDPERLVAWTEVTDLDVGARAAVERLTKFAESNGRRLSTSDGVVLSDMGDIDDGMHPGRWQLAISLEAGAELAPMSRDGIHVETWPAVRVAGVFLREDPRAGADRRAALLRHLKEAGLTPAPRARWQVLYSLQSAAEPFESRLSLLRLAVVSK
ncbi:MAG TPA: UbiA family prenyltransferase [Galbitalea sp.]|jgi:4-hydroxybenzoate polyprenyltransferase|nr:UbiA family prenyltransferase [Galbitalea sp.]